MNRAVTEAFVILRQKKLIYRDDRLVNWCCELRTALSDLEVEYKDFEGIQKLKVPGHDKLCEFGVLHEFAYRLKDSEDEINVATTRLETMLGDTAVAVHPEDERHRHLIGKEIQHPFCADRVMKVIADPELVDMSFGTGAVKVTPAHDFSDFECGNRNSL